MNNIRNNVRLIGNLGMNPEVRTLQNDQKLVSFSLATTESYKDKEGNRVKETQWHRLVAWGKTAQIAEKYLQKGSEVAIEGKLTTRQYTTKDGEKRSITEVVVSDILLMDKKSN
jgi:single-strand DNA-binding protein